MTDQSQTIRYRRCTIERRWVTTRGRPQPDEWTWVHDEYTGPEDKRCGTGGTAEDCVEQIDDLEAGRLRI